VTRRNAAASGPARRLRAAGERVTSQRLEVAQALTGTGTQVSAGELWRSLRRGHSRLGRATVFRALEALVAAGLARRLELEDHVYRYVGCQPAHHHHLACRECGKVVDIPESFVEPMARTVAAAVGFQLDDARLDFYGRCASCLSQTGSGVA
jgi:Fur family ferric uptake transcriptional regulator